MTVSLKKLLLLSLAPAVAAFAANTQVSSDRPITNFRLPTFTSDGFRDSMVRGSEARMVKKDEVAIKDLTMTVFTGLADERIKTMILSPTAVVHLANPKQAVVTGPDTIRVISDELEATGVNWRYERQDQDTSVISIKQHVRITFRAEFKDYLK